MPSLIGIPTELRVSFTYQKRRFDERTGPAFWIPNRSAGLALFVLGWHAAYAGCWQSESVWHREYTAAWTAAEEAYARGDYAAGAGLYEKVTEWLPHEPLTRFRWACCLARIGQIEPAWTQLQASIDAGWDDPDRLAATEDLATLQGNPRFREIVESAKACRDEEWVVHSARSADPDAARGVLILLQGLGCGPRSEIPFWAAAADELNLIVVAPRAPHRFGPMLYGWQHRREQGAAAPTSFYDLVSAQRQIGRSLEMAAKRFAIDERRLVLAGFSQGGGVALHLLRQQPSRFRGAVVVASRYPAEDGTDWPSDLPEHSFRVAILAGRLDRWWPDSQRAAEELAAAQIPHRLIDFPQVGHEYPPEFTREATGALQYLLSEAR